MNYMGERTRGRARGRKLIQRNNTQKNCHSELNENLLDKESFLSIIGYSVAQFDQEVSVALENYMTVQGWFDSYGGGRSPSCVCDSPFEENLLESNISEAMPFVSDRGYLCFTYSLYTQMGYQSNDVCIDLVTNDYIDEINEQPINVNWISCTN